MTQVNYKAMTDNELNNIYNEIHDNSLKCIFKYKQRLHNYIKTYLPYCELLELHDNMLTIAFNEKEGWFRNLTIEIYFGIDFWNEKKGFKFQINPSSIGTFDIFGTSEEKAYYMAIGTILSNDEFNLVLHGTLKNFYEEYTPIKNDIWDLSSEIRNREHKKKIEQELTKSKDEFISTKEQILSKDNYSGKYVIITKHDKGEFNNAIYRKKNVRVMPYGVDEYHVMLATVMSKFGRYWEDNYRLVMVDKIKLIEE